MDQTRWDNESETGIKSPVHMEIHEDDVLLAEITAETPAHAITTALCLLETTMESQPDSPMKRAVARCAEIMNDATIIEAETAWAGAERRYGGERRTTGGDRGNRRSTTGRRYQD